MVAGLFIVVITITGINSLTNGFLSDSPDGPLKIAAFNIQTFGQAKMSDIAVASNIVTILQRYDVVLIQEVRDSSGSALVDLQTHLNSSGSWSFVASRPVGRTSYKEQYAFFYRTRSIRIVGQHLYNDSVHDYFEREPFSIEFQYYSVTKLAFRYMVFLGLHTRPDDTPNELIHLPRVIKNVSTHFNNADGVVAMGDFNADCRYLNSTMRRSLEIFTPNSDFKNYINDSADTTVATTTNCAYDRVISLGNNIDIRNAEPFNFKIGLSLSTNASSAVSDHYPVEFKLY